MFSAYRVLFPKQTLTLSSFGVSTFGIREVWMPCFPRRQTHMQTPGMRKASCISSFQPHLPPASQHHLFHLHLQKRKALSWKLWPSFSWLNVIIGAAFWKLSTLQALCQTLSIHCLVYVYNSPMREVLLLFYHRKLRLGEIMQLSEVRQLYGWSQGWNPGLSEWKSCILLIPHFSISWNPVGITLKTSIFFRILFMRTGREITQQLLGKTQEFYWTVNWMQ